MATEKMEVDDPKRFIAKNLVSSYTVQLHPLIILNIADHWTRIRAQLGKTSQIFGAIVGKKLSKHLEVSNSYELVHTWIDNKPIIDKAYFDLKSQQFKEVFFDVEFLGWYTTGDEMPDESDVLVHKQLSDITETPVFIKVTPNSNYSDLPVAIYEPTDIVNDSSPLFFTKVTFTLVTEESERIGIDYIVRTAHTETDDSSVAVDQLNTHYNAIRMLNDRLKLLIAYVNEVEAKRLPIDPTILRGVKTLIVNLNKMKPLCFEKAYYAQGNDVALITYLATVTKGTNTINQFINKMRAKHGFGEPRSGVTTFQ